MAPGSKIKEAISPVSTETVGANSTNATLVRQEDAVTLLAFMNDGIIEHDPALAAQAAQVLSEKLA